MSLNVETGTGSATSESYISVADADLYHSNRGNTTWADLSTEHKEQALRRATDYMLQVYRLRWNGTRVNGTQALDFPRALMVRDDYNYSGLNGYTYIGGNYYYPSDIVPVEVKNACAELAFKAAGGDLAPDLTQNVKKEKIDVIEVEYDTYSPQYTRYRAIDQLLMPLLKSSGASHQVRRT